MTVPPPIYPKPPKRNPATLPKWAQDRIALLERELVKVRDEARGVVGGISDVFLGDVVHGNRALIPGSTVVFMLGEDSRHVIEVKHSPHDPQKLEVRARDGRLLMAPIASNTVNVTVEDW